MSAEVPFALSQFTRLKDGRAEKHFHRRSAVKTCGRPWANARSQLYVYVAPSGEYQWKLPSGCEVVFTGRPY